MANAAKVKVVDTLLAIIGCEQKSDRNEVKFTANTKQLATIPDAIFNLVVNEINIDEAKISADTANKIAEDAVKAIVDNVDTKVNNTVDAAAVSLGAAANNDVKTAIKKALEISTFIKKISSDDNKEIVLTNSIYVLLITCNPKMTNKTELANCWKIVQSNRDILGKLFEVHKGGGSYYDKYVKYKSKYLISKKQRK